MRLSVCLLVLYLMFGLSAVFLVPLWFATAASWHNREVRRRVVR